MDILSPIDDSQVGTIPKMSPSEVNQAVEAAFLAQKNWENEKLPRRVELIKKVAQLLEKQKDDFAKTLVLEIGKPQGEAEDEVLRTIEMLDDYCQEALRLESEVLADEKRKKIALIERVPLGVVLAISPFNYPLNEAAPKIVAALLTGNTVIFKPSTQGAITGLSFARLFKEAGIPQNVLKVITGQTEKLGDVLVSHPKIAAINFTGSYQTALHLTKIAGIKKLVLGLSGKDAALVLEDCELERAVKEVAGGAFSFAGQRCTAVKRVFLLSDVADKFLNLFVREVEEKFILGDPRKAGITLGPVINLGKADYLEELVGEAKEKGAIVLSGGRRKGQFWEATILDYVTAEMRIAWEEPFGPILPILRVKNEEQAIDLINKSEYGLQASIFTKDLDRALEIAKKLEVGTVQINGRPSRAPDHFPFTGFKHSGLGMAAGAKYLMREMTRLKTTVFNL